jgi:protein arginine N-methyltransferase 1
MSSDRQSCDFYFDTYAHFGIHERMLKDTPRTNAYLDAISRNPSLFHGKAVLDVGCGTGIFCLAAAQAGAAKVYGVEQSSIIESALQIVEANGLADKIHLLYGDIRKLTIPEPVDVILSDWMGYTLFHESMLPAVISARDRFMKPNGMMLPSRAMMFIAGIEDATYRAKKIEFWDSVYGFSYDPIKKWALVEPLVDRCPGDRIVTEHCKLLDLDLNTCPAEVVNVDAPFELVPELCETMHAFVVWFTVLFEGTEEQIELTTSPFQEPTRWHQTVFYLEEPLDVTPNVRIRGRFQMRPSPQNAKEEDIVIAYRMDEEEEHTQSFKMT